MGPFGPPACIATHPGTPSHMAESYTPGHSQNAVNFMARRGLASHGQFIVPALDGATQILDAGCGPGSITCDVAEHCPQAEVLGIDFAESQVEAAREQANARSLQNVSFKQASGYELPFADGCFDVVYSHALLEHLSEPGKVIAEFHRVLKPGGKLAVCSPDWAGFLLAPPSAALDSAITEYIGVQTANGGDVYVGRKFGSLLLAAGFHSVEMQARYENYESPERPCEYLARLLESTGATQSAATLRAWSREPAGMFAQTWVSCLGVK